MTFAPAHSQPTVLIVDDAVAVSTTLVWVLRENGYNTRAARSMAEALQLCAKTTPDLALIEMSLPDGTGIETARQLRRYAPACQFLFMSGDPDAGSCLQQAQAAGFPCELLPKPIPVEELLRQLQAALPHHRPMVAARA